MARKKNSNDYDDNWIVENFWKFDRTDEMSEKYNELHGTSFSKEAIRSHCYDKLGLQRKNRRHKAFGEAEDEFLKRNYPILSSKELEDEFLIQFGYRREGQELRLRCWYLGIKKEEDAAKRSREISQYKRELGEELIDASGYVKVKVSTHGNSNERWKLKHREIWKAHHGEIPEGHVLVFLDGNKQNCDIENLACVPFNYLGYLSSFKRRSESPLITKTQIVWCDLQEAIKKVQKGESA